MKDNFEQDSDYTMLNKEKIDGLILLIKNGAKPTNEVVYRACESNMIDVIAAIYDSKYRSCLNKELFAKTPLNIAIDSSSTDVALFLINHNLSVNIKKSEDNKTPLEYSCMHYNKKIMGLLIKTGKYDLQKTLAWVCSNINNKYVVKTLCEYGANLHERDINGKDLLHYACCTDNLKVIEYLIENLEVNINSSDSLGNTYLHYACLYQREKTIKYLLSLNANVNQKNKSGESPIFALCQSKSSIKSANFMLLLDNGALTSYLNLNNENIVDILKKRTRYTQTLQTLLNNY